MTRKHLLATLFAFTLFGLGCLQQSAAETPHDPADAPKPSTKLTHRFSDTGRDVAPIALTAADGSGLELKLFKAETVIQGPLAFTELRLTFRNPEARVREGRFRITLPEKAAISRFAMRIDDVWQEAEVVEKQAARRAYEDFLHRRQDPALLEKAAGNEFRARIFPIPANGEKELVLSYSQELPRADSPYRVNLQGLPMIEDFEIAVQTQQGNKTKKLVLKEKDYQPQGDFELSGFVSDDTLFDGSYLVSRVTPEVDSSPERIENLLILLDTSASRALGFQNQVELTEDLVKALTHLEKLTVASFDQDVSLSYQGPGRKFQGKNLLQRKALGATDLSKALAWAAQKKEHTRLLLISDGISTAGSSQLAEALKSSAGLQRIDVVLVGGIRDRDKMERLVEKPLSRQGVVLDSERPVQELAGRLQKSVTSGVDVSVRGAEWTWPETLSSVQPRDQRLIYANLTKPTDRLQLQLGTQNKQLSPRHIEATPLLLRQATVAQISLLESQLSVTDDPEVQQQLSDEIVKLSTKHRVLSEKTALLVLETDEDYERFNIDREALADILVVGKNGLELQNRHQIHLPETTEREIATQESEKLEKDKNVTINDVAPTTEESADQPSVATTEVPQAEERIQADLESRPAESARPSVGRAAPARRPRVPPRVEPRDSSVPVADEEEESLPEEPKKQERPSPLTGEFAKIEALLQTGEKTEALAVARTWQENSPGDVLALIALGNCLEALGKKDEAARVFGSIIDLFPSRADLRRYAAGRLQRLGEEPLDLAVDCFEKAAEQRPDHVSSHRFYAMALARQGEFEQAMEALEAGLSRKYPSGRFRSYDRILRDDLGLLAAAWLRKDPSKKKSIYDRLEKYDSKMAKSPSLRFILTWETDANDVDFHIRDEEGGHAYYSSPKLPSGGELYGDVTTGYGPECFAIDGKPTAYPYDLEIHYFSRGPMGYGMGQLEILRHDGNGRLSFQERPYVVMTDGAYVDLGLVND